MKGIITSILLTIVSLALSEIGFAQQYPSYGQYYFNRSMYNPSFVGNSKYIEAAVTHHQQWMGIEDAPSISTLYFHYPTKKNVSLGLSAINDKSILLSTTSIMGTYSYKVPLGRDQHLKFGLSMGVGNNNFDLEEVNIQDPTVFNAANSTLFMDGQFGVHYRWKLFELGFALPRIRLSQLNGPEQSVIFTDNDDTRLGMKLLSANYKIPLNSSGLVFEPGVLYRWFTNFENQIEGYGVLHIRDVISLGGSYREDGAATAFFGVKFLDKLSFGYSYGTAPLQAIGLSGGSHEVQLKLWFMKKDKRTITTKPENKYDEGIAPSYLYNTRKRTNGNQEK